MNLQDRVLSHLLGKPKWKTRLVARFDCASLGLPRSRTASVFIPDVHLLSSRTSPKYPNYGTNSVEVLKHALFALRDARDELRETGDELETIQLGDLFDLWRERRWGKSDDPRGDIERTHSHLVQILYQHPSGLRATRIVGNHDASMRGAAGFVTHALIPDENPVVLVLHGHELDPREGRPQWLSQLGVWIGSRHRAGTYSVPVADVDSALTEAAKNQGDFATHLELEEPADLGSLQRLDAPDAIVESDFGVRHTSDGSSHPLLERARTLYEKLRADGLASLRVLVVGHTHHAKVLVDDASGAAEPMVLVDVGAWIEKYRADGETGPNCQIGVLTSDEVRLYQLDPVP